MGRHGDRKKAGERELLDEYLSFSRLSPKKVRPGERPDFVVELTTKEGVTTIGIELCEYQSDARSRGGSQSRALRAFHDRVSRAVEGQGFVKMKVNCWLSYDESNPPRSADAGRFADECMAFMRLKEIEVPPFVLDSCGRTYKRWRGDLDCFPLLKGAVENIRLAGRAIQDLSAFWYNDTASTRLGIPAHIMRARIREHDVSKWPETQPRLDEKWLVVCASVETAHDFIGPKLEAVENSLDQLREEARASGFDLVSFWERRAGWEHRIWDATEGRGNA